MIKWLWKLVVGHGCWGRSCQWETVERRELLNMDKERIGAAVYQTCRTCKLERRQELRG
jgi:hypothetical protein